VTDAESATLPEGSPAGAPDASAPASPLEAENARLRAREEELLRALAEMSNVQKRRKNETEGALRYANESLVRGLLPVLDDLDRALASAPAGAEGADDPIRAGVTLVRDRLMNVLRQEGLAPIHSKGAPFDPTLHDAISVAPAPPGVSHGTVLEEASVGYRFKDRVLRHAKVVVADGPSSPETADEEGAP
jgi:molecular chaperone GrpE